MSKKYIFHTLAGLSLILFIAMGIVFFSNKETNSYLSISGLSDSALVDSYLFVKDGKSYNLNFEKNKNFFSVNPRHPISITNNFQYQIDTHIQEEDDIFYDISLQLNKGTETGKISAYGFENDSSISIYLDKRNIYKNIPVDWAGQLTLPIENFSTAKKLCLKVNGSNSNSYHLCHRLAAPLNKNKSSWFIRSAFSNERDLIERKSKFFNIINDRNNPTEHNLDMLEITLDETKSDPNILDIAKTLHEDDIKYGTEITGQVPDIYAQTQTFSNGITFLFTKILSPIYCTRHGCTISLYLSKNNNSWTNVLALQADQISIDPNTAIETGIPELLITNSGPAEQFWRWNGTRYEVFEPRTSPQ